MSTSVHFNEFRLARHILAQTDRYHATPVEIRALMDVIQAFIQGRGCDAEALRIARSMMRAIAADQE